MSKENPNVSVVLARDPGQYLEIDNLEIIVVPRTSGSGHSITGSDSIRHAL